MFRAGRSPDAIEDRCIMKNKTVYREFAAGARAFAALVLFVCTCGAAHAAQINTDETVVLSTDSAESYELGSGVTLTIEVASGNTVVLSGGITGAGTLRKTGLGTLALSNSGNVIPGGIDVTEGTVRADAAGALGNGELRIVQGATVKGNVTFNVAGATFFNPITVTGTYKSAPYVISAPVTTTLKGAITALNGVRAENADGSTLTIDGDVNAGSNIFYLRPIKNGAHVLNGKVTANFLELGSAASATGEVYLNNPSNSIVYFRTYQPTIHCGDTNVLRGAYWTVQATAGRASGGHVLDLHGHDQTMSYLVAGQYTENGTPKSDSTLITSSEPCTLTLTGDTSTHTTGHKINGAVSLMVAADSSKFTQVFTDIKAGQTTTHLTTGNITVKKGKLRVAGSGTSFNAVPNVTVEKGATLDIATSGQTVFPAVPRFIVNGTLTVGADALSPFSSDVSAWYSPLTLGEDATLAIDNDTVQRFAVVRVVVNGETVRLAEGTYEAGDTRVPQLTAGSFVVMGARPVAAATWTGEGADAAITTEENWSEDGINVELGIMSATFASGGNTAAVSSAVAFSNVTLCAAAGETGFSFAKGAAAATFAMAGDALAIADTDATARTYSFGMPLVVSGTQTLAVTVPAAKTLSFFEGVRAEDGAVSFAGGGTVNVAGTSVLPGTLSLPAGMTMNVSGAATLLSGVSQVAIGPGATLIVSTAGQIAFPDVQAVNVEGALSVGADAGFPFAGGSALTLGASATFAVSNDTVPRFASVSVVEGDETVTLEKGVYAYPDARVPQLTAGSFVVTASSATWTGEGGADTAITTAANWDETYFDIENGSMSATFATGGDTATISTPVKFNDVTLAAAEGKDGFSFEKGAAAATFAMTGDTLTVADADSTSRAYSFGVPFLLDGEQALSATVFTNKTLSFLGGFRAKSGSFSFAGGGTVVMDGSNVVAGAMTVPGSAFFRVSGVLEAPGGVDQGLAENNGPYTLTVSGGGNTYQDRLYGLTLAGASVSKPICIKGNGSYSAKHLFRTAENTTNVISGNILSWPGAGKQYVRLRTDSELTCRGGLRTSKGPFNVNGDAGSRLVFTEKPVTATVEYVNSSTGRYYGFGVARGHVVFDVADNAIDYLIPGNSDDNGYSAAVEFMRSDMFSGYETTLAAGMERNSKSILAMHTKATSQTVEFHATTQRFARVVSGPTATFTGDSGSLLEVYGAQGEDTTGNIHVSSDVLHVAAKFEGGLSLKMSGTGTLLVTNAVSTTTGGVEVTSGTVKFASDASWANASHIAVGGTGRLEIDAGGATGRMLTLGRNAAVSLSGDGVLEIPDGCVLEAESLEIDGSRARFGAYTHATAPAGIKAHLANTTGVLRIGRTGTIFTIH